MVRIFLLLALCSGTILSAVPSRKYLVFRENFNGPLSEKWVYYPGPSPRLSRRRGNPVPAFGGNGFQTSGSGIVSKRLFGLRKGLVISCDMLMIVADGKAWSGGTFRLVGPERDFITGAWPDPVVGMSYDYLGKLWIPGTLMADEGTLVCTMLDEDGDRETRRFPFRNRYLGEWHRYEIKICPDGFVEFRVDGEPVYYSRKKIVRDPDHLRLMLGQRSGRSGRVYLDNLEVSSFRK